MREAVQVDQIGRERLLQLEEPGPGSVQIALGARHPLEREPAMNQRQTVDRSGCETLLGCRGRAEHRQHHFDVRSAETARQLKGMVPDPADGIGGHQHPPGQGARGAHAARALELGERSRPVVLNVAEVVELAQIVPVRPFPGLIIRGAPQLAVVRRAGIGEQGHGVVGPDPIGPHLFAPALDREGIVGGRLDQVGLHERYVLLGEDQPLGQLGGVDPAVLVEGVAPLWRQAFDPGFDRDAAGSTQELDHCRLPQIDPGLHAEGHLASDQGFEQRPVGQEDLIDEVEVLHALFEQAVDLGQERIEIAPAVAVAKQFLGAERAVVRAASGRFDLRPRAGRRALEPVVVRQMAPHQLVRPGQRGGIDERGRLRAAVDPDAATIPEGDAGQIVLLALGEARQHLLAFAHDHDVGPELVEHRARRRRAMRADRHQHAGILPHRGRQLLRHTQLGRRTAPEQVSRRRSEHAHIGTESP